MLKFKTLPILAGAATLLAIGLLAGAPARADVFTFTSCHLSTGCGTATEFGTTTLTQQGSDVKFDVVLNSGDNFISTGAGAKSLFLFNDTLSSSAVTNISATFNGAVVAITGGLSGNTNVVDAMGNPTLHADGTGDFSAQVFCTTDSSCNGASGVPVNDLHFTVTNATLAQLETPNATGNLFVADILCGQTGCGGSTGAIDVSVPAPIIGHGLFVLLAIGGVLGGSKLLENRKKLHLQAA